MRNHRERIHFVLIEQIKELLFLESENQNGFFSWKSGCKENYSGLLVGARMIYWLEDPRINPSISYKKNYVSLIKQEGNKKDRFL